MSNHIVLEKWKKFQLKIEKIKNQLDRETLLVSLIDLVEDLNNVKDPIVQKLYLDFLEYFEHCRVKQEILEIEPWYSLGDLVDHEILVKSENSVERPIVKIRDLLWELLVFKSDIECPNCAEDNLRTLVSENGQDLLFACDKCGYIIDEDGDKFDANQRLYPASFDLIKFKKIGVSPI